jgi:hypothetical protein
MLGRQRDLVEEPRVIPGGCLDRPSPPTHRLRIAKGIGQMMPMKSTISDMSSPKHTAVSTPSLVSSLGERHEAVVSSTARRRSHTRVVQLHPCQLSRAQV